MTEKYEKFSQFRSLVDKEVMPLRKNCSTAAQFSIPKNMQSSGADKNARTKEHRIPTIILQNKTPCCTTISKENHSSSKQILDQ